MLENNFAISELQRKMANIVRIGVVKEIDYEKAKVRVNRRIFNRLFTMDNEQSRKR